MNLTLKNDVVFKSFFSKKGNERFLISFLESLLNLSITHIEIIKDASLEKLFINDKLGILDIQATINDGTTINIEMQVVDKHDIEKRTLFYGAKQVSAQMCAGDFYGDLKKVILVNILDFSFINLPEYYTKTVRVADKHRDYPLVNDVEYHFIELPKFREQLPKVANVLEAWLAFIDNFRNEEIVMSKEARKLINDAKYLTGDEEMRRLAELRQKAIWDENSIRHYATEQGLKEGREQGIQQKSKEIAIKLLKKQYDISLIQELTELSIEQIQSLKNELKL